MNITFVLNGKEFGGELISSSGKIRIQLETGKKRKKAQFLVRNSEILEFLKTIKFSKEGQNSG